MAVNAMIFALVLHFPMQVHAGCTPENGCKQPRMHWQLQSPTLRALAWCRLPLEGCVPLRTRCDNVTKQALLNPEHPSLELRLAITGYYLLSSVIAYTRAS